ncbi:MAG: hypothetical protein GY850_03240 [bacterium]|nr:hypothetical protein [bacterium]
MNSLLESQAERLSKPALNTSLPPTEAIGASKTAAIALSIGTMMKTAAAYALDTGRKI